MGDRSCDPYSRYVLGIVPRKNIHWNIRDAYLHAPRGIRRGLGKALWREGFPFCENFWELRRKNVESENEDFGNWRLSMEYLGCLFASIENCKRYLERYFWTWKWQFWEIVKVLTGIFEILICAPCGILKENSLEDFFFEKKCWTWKWWFWELKSIYGVFGMFICIYKELQETFRKIFLWKFLNLKMVILRNHAM